jgi:hypothetical protein
LLWRLATVVIFGRFLSAAVALILVAHVARGQEVPCVPCSVPCRTSLADTVFDIRTSDGGILQNFRSVQRTIITDFEGNKRQALHLFAYRDGKCIDTIVSAQAVRSVSTGGLGSMGSPLVLPVYPSRELWRTTSSVAPINFIEITPFVGYGGQDTSSRKIGFPSVYEGLEVLAAPFGDMLGTNTVLAVGAELLMESSRIRIPAMAQLRYTFGGGQHLVDSAKYYPNSCALQCPGASPAANPYPTYSETQGGGRKDSASFFVHEQVVAHSMLQPFVYGEAAYIFNTGFDGAGKDPSLNPEDYGQYFLGAGIGSPLFGHFTVSIGYRLMRLNLRTPCEACQNKFIVNTDVSNALLAKFGLRF